jgi:hypothetical protein
VRRSIRQISFSWLSVYSQSGKPDLAPGPENGVHFNSDINVEDVHSPSIYGRYQPPMVEDEDEEEEPGTLCVALTFYTESGEETRYIQDSESDDAAEVLSQVLSVLGQKGWQAVNVIIDEQFEETWYLQRIVRR